MVCIYIWYVYAFLVCIYTWCVYIEFCKICVCRCLVDKMFTSYRCRYVRLDVDGIHVLDSVYVV